LLLAAPGIQSHRGTEIPNSPGTERLRSEHHQSAAGGGTPCGLLGMRLGIVSPELGAGIRRVKGVRRLGIRVGNWLTPAQGKLLLEQSDTATLRGKRNHAILAMLIGCGLRRGELLSLAMDSIQVREEHWVIADLKGKAGHIRTVPVPQWVKAAVDAWSNAAGITKGTVFRSINKSGRVWGEGMTPKVLWEAVKEAASRAGIEKLAPPDLRRTCARLCHLAKRRTGPNSVSARARFESNDRTIPRLQAEAESRGQRQARN